MIIASLHSLVSRGARPWQARPTRRAVPLATGAAALAAMLLPTLHHPQLRLVWNASASVPLGLYRIDPHPALRIGELVAVRPSPALSRFMAQRRYVEANALLLKPIAAMGGATICRHGLRVSIGGRPVVAALLHDRIARPMPIWSGCRRLRDNELFLIAPSRPDSFDGRYFGPVDRRQIVGRAVPVWTWS